MRDTIDMVREANIKHMQQTTLHIVTLSELKAFEALVRADERTECAEHYLGIMRNAIKEAVQAEREACHALRQTLPNPHEHCQVSAHAYDMALVAYGAAIRARGNT